MAINMNDKAYLVGTWSTKQSPPTMTRAHIFSESGNTLTTSASERNMDIAVAEGKDFSEACEKLIKLIVEQPYYHWVFNIPQLEKELEVAKIHHS
jgi:hypothetical protein